MTKVQTDVSLAPFNTFQVDVKAKKFLELTSVADIPNEKALILGRGANILFTKDYDGLIIKNNLLGKKQLSEDTFEIASGEDWIELVNWSVKNGWSGIENLAFIPGTVGAAAVGNIAAYGQNFEDVIVSVKTVDGFFEKKDCNFSYRDSIFGKNPQNFVTSITIKLSKQPEFDTNYHSRYESLKAVLPNHPAIPYTPQEIATAVTTLRKTKLPDWTKIGTAGSFFKNPNVTSEKFVELSKQIMDLQSYPANKLSYSPNIPHSPNTLNLVKIPAGRLLEELGWKGKRIGNVGTFEKHALIVVNYGGATGVEILDFSRQMQADVKKNFDIDLEPEVNII